MTMREAFNALVEEIIRFEHSEQYEQASNEDINKVKFHLKRARESLEKIEEGNYMHIELLESDFRISIRKLNAILNKYGIDVQYKE